MKKGKFEGHPHQLRNRRKDTPESWFYNDFSEGITLYTAHGGYIGTLTWDQIQRAARRVGRKLSVRVPASEHQR